MGYYANRTSNDINWKKITKFKKQFQAIWIGSDDKTTNNIGH